MRAALLLALLAPALWGADKAVEREYRSIFHDESNYVGEATAGAALPLDELKAKARAALSEMIRVRVKSETRDRLKLKDGKASGEFSASVEQVSDIIFDEESYFVAEDHPEKGRRSVLAWITKEEYERQLAERRPDRFRIRWGLGAELGYAGFGSFDSLVKREDRLKGFLGEDAAELDGLFGPRVSLRWRDLFFSWEEYLQRQVRIYPWNAAASGYQAIRDDFSSTSLELGYEYTPWRGRLQPYLPISLGWHMMKVQEYRLDVPAASLGLGLRYWAGDHWALTLSGHYRLGFGDKVLGRGGDESRPFLVNPSESAKAGAESLRAQLGIIWTPF